MVATKEISTKLTKSKKKRSSDRRRRASVKSSGRSQRSAGKSSGRSRREVKSHAISSKQAKIEFNKLRGDGDTTIIAKGLFITLFVLYYALRCSIL